MSQKTVRSLLESRLSAWAKARTPVLRIAYQGVAFEPQPGETYLAAFLLPAATNSITLDGSDRVYTGIFQISVVAPAGTGTGSAEGIADELDPLFPNGLRLSLGELSLITLSPVDVAAPVMGSTTLTVPASFQYRASVD